MSPYYLVDIRGRAELAAHYLAANGIHGQAMREQFGYTVFRIDPSQLRAAEALMRARASKVLAIRAPRPTKVNPSARRTRSRTGHHIPRKVLEFRESRRRGSVLKPSTFKRIERRAAKRYGSKAAGRRVAGKVYWETLEAQYRRTHRSRPRLRSNPVRSYYVQEERGEVWHTVATFQSASLARQYARALHKANPHRRHRVI